MAEICGRSAAGYRRRPRRRGRRGRRSAWRSGRAIEARWRSAPLLAAVQGEPVGGSRCRCPTRRPLRTRRRRRRPQRRRRALAEADCGSARAHRRTAVRVAVRGAVRARRRIAGRCARAVDLSRSRLPGRTHAVGRVAVRRNRQVVRSTWLRSRLIVRLTAAIHRRAQSGRHLRRAARSGRRRPAAPSIIPGWSGRHRCRCCPPPEAQKIHRPRCAVSADANACAAQPELSADVAALSRIGAPRRIRIHAPSGQKLYGIKAKG